MLGAQSRLCGVISKHDAQSWLCCNISIHDAKSQLRDVAKMNTRSFYFGFRCGCSDSSSYHVARRGDLLQ
ncbi:hypothetical protein SESBI_24397 [Sesbania bispinosa]|nr:hypothetical protein SESBI_24397 [Sesbania bispinosa]